eukprot:CAMPEP_0197357096 /NCGR_PEP_ID=MMETSP0893-20130614/51190_1 /TAXON_ID=44058 ORGANISM="Aureoumbra lagunensis, Strain CCMP1510" /NCGR_SAMPLE_ID=MMETSP0893 /ASSEMBLY_ACC=CAM_ASM_000539 /LENGTH=83 /DNA_ID=CAMNT_0042875379 /DNA_START=16 /DNA_END=267 /DNA_ORIENTATION=+
MTFVSNVPLELRRTPAVLLLVVITVLLATLHQQQAQRIVKDVPEVVPQLLRVQTIVKYVKKTSMLIKLEVLSVQNVLQIQSEF